MKINHEFVRKWIRWVSVSLFIGAALYKFKRIIDAGKVDIDNGENEELSGTSEAAEPVVTEPDND